MKNNNYMSHVLDIFVYILQRVTTDSLGFVGAYYGLKLFVNF